MVIRVMEIVRVIGIIGAIRDIRNIRAIRWYHHEPMSVFEEHCPHGSDAFMPAMCVCVCVCVLSVCA